MDQPILFIKRQSGSVTAPAICFASCNNAIVVAQKLGKSPALCLPDSPFIRYYNDCTKCIEANGSSSTDKALPDLAQQFISYCSLGLTTSTTTFTLTDGQVSTIFYVAPAAASASSTISRSCAPSYTLCPDLGSCCPSGHSCVNGSCYAPSTTTLSPAMSSTTSPTASPTITLGIISSATSPTVPNSSTKSKAWIAGPVIGSIALIALILGLLFYFRKRGRKTTIAHNESGSPYEKAELHADEVKKPVYETETHEVHEVEGSSPSPAEKPANETLMELAAVEAKREGGGSNRDNETK